MKRFQGYLEDIIRLSIKSCKRKQNKSKGNNSEQLSEEDKEKVQSAGGKKYSRKNKRTVNKKKALMETKGQFWKTIGHF